MADRVRPRPTRIRQTHQPTPLTILDAINDPYLFAPWFKNPDSWLGWFAFIAALFGLPMTGDQAALYRQCTGRNEPPPSPASEGWLICGRRAGKSFILALIAVFLACFFDYRPYLSPGERGTVMVIAADRKQARTIIRYIRALLTRIPMLAQMIEREAVESFEFVNQTVIEVHSASFRSTRGYTIVAALCDELAFWSVDDGAADPDREIIAALRPGMSTIPNALLLCASSPYARKGELYNAHRRHFGKDSDPVLVWQAATRTMNPTVPQRVIDDAMERDPASAAAEYLATFRQDIEDFISRETVTACVATGVRERPYIAGKTYKAFIDPSGGSSDSMTLAIGHREGGTAILDAIRERKPPFSPEDVTNEFAALLKAYKVRKVVGDRFAGEWVREPLRKFGIEYDLAPRPKSDLYRDLLPLVNSKRADLLDHDRLVNQLVSLERRTTRGGREQIDHPPGASSHDDVANVVAGVLTTLIANQSRYDLTKLVPDDDLDDYRALKLHRYVHSFR